MMLSITMQVQILKFQNNIFSITLNQVLPFCGRSLCCSNLLTLCIQSQHYECKINSALILTLWACNYIEYTDLRH